MGKIFIADGNNWAHRAFHAMKNLSYNGNGTGAIFGFLNILEGNLTRYKPKKIYVCWDDGRNQNRLNLLPGYKQRDPKLGMDYESFHKQKRTIMVMLKALGLIQLWDENHEADDFIYSLVKRKSKNPKNKIVVGSGDKDFRQLVKNNVLIHDENKGLITPLNFKKHFSLKPEQYSDYLALMGDSSDKIPGVPSFGEKRALDFLHLHYSYDLYKVACKKDNNIRHPKHNILLEVWERNRTLIDLKLFDDTYGPFPLVYWQGLKEPEPNIKKYQKLCAKYGIKKFATNNFLNKIP